MSGASSLSFCCFFFLFFSFMSDNGMWHNFVFVCSFPTSSSEEKVSVSCWESKGIFGVRQGFWRARFLLNLYFFIFWVQSLLRFGRIWKLWKRVSASFPFSLEILSFCLPFFIYLYIFFFLSGMTTRFSKQKFAKAQEKKAKGGLVSGLLPKKC